MTRIPLDLELVLTLAMIWIPVSLLAALALGWAFQATHGDDQ